MAGQLVFWPAWQRRSGLELLDPHGSASASLVILLILGLAFSLDWY
jgi:hypothetical protein